MTGKTDAQVALLAAARDYKRAQIAMESKRRRLWAAIFDADAAGVSKSQIARDCGLTREYVTVLLGDDKKRAEAFAE